MSKSDTDSNSESYKSLSDEESKMLTAREDDSSSDMESSDETVEPEMEASKCNDDATDDNVTTNDEESTTMMTSPSPPPPTPSPTPTDVEMPTLTPDAQATAALLTSVVDSKSNIEIAGLNRTKYSRAEKKARRMLIKQGAKPLPNISRLVMRQGMVLFVIEDAEIYKNPRSDTFIVFGEVKIEDVSKQQQNIMACSQIKAAQTISEAAKLHDTKAALTNEAIAADDEALDETGIDPTDINLVMSQASVTRAKAVRALKANNNDIVNAIMELTM